VFFENILRTILKKNSTLCYARIGLNKQSEKHWIFYIDLKKYPGDLEIELNYAEALLWNNKFDEAKVFYSWTC
jgi:hypothetical protein